MQDTFKIPKLKGSQNYDIWSIRIQAIIIEKGYSNYILEDTSSNILEENALKTTAIIKLALEDGPLLQTRFISNPYTLQISLENLYRAKGFSSEFILSKELINTTLNYYKGNLEEYLNAFKRVVNNLEARGINLPKKFIIALLLNNLNKDYKYVVTIITQSIRVTDNINLEEIISQLLDKSRRITSIRTSKNYLPSYRNSNTISNNSKVNNSNYSRDVEMSLNTSNTTSKNNSKKGTSSNSKKELKCNFCNYKGHKESTCYKKFPNLREKQVNITTREEEQILATSINSSSIKNKSSTIDFILDSGATIHTCYIKELFTSIRPTNISIKQGNTNKIIKAEGIGGINVLFTSTKRLVKLENVLYVPSLGVNLLSLSKITSRGYNLSFYKDNCYINTPNKDLLAKGSYKQGVSYFSTRSTNNNVLNNSNSLTILSTIEE